MNLSSEHSPTRIWHEFERIHAEYFLLLDAVVSRANLYAICQALVMNECQAVRFKDLNKILGKNPQLPLEVVIQQLRTISSSQNIPVNITLHPGFGYEISRQVPKVVIDQWPNQLSQLQHLILSQLLSNELSVEEIREISYSHNTNFSGSENSIYLIMSRLRKKVRSLEIGVITTVKSSGFYRFTPNPQTSIQKLRDTLVEHLIQLNMNGKSSNT